MIYLNILYYILFNCFKLLITLHNNNSMLNLAIVEIATNITLNEFVFLLIDNLFLNEIINLSFVVYVDDVLKILKYLSYLWSEIRLL